REGLSGYQHDNEVVVWEVHQRDRDGKWTIETYSPKCPTDNVRPVQEEPPGYSEDGKPSHPFVDFFYEVKDKGWYSPRGIPELVAPHEAALTKMWNEKLDCITLYNRPLFTSQQQLPNALNLQFAPGQVLPYG